MNGKLTVSLSASETAAIPTGETITDAMIILTKEKLKTSTQSEKYNWSVFAKKVYDLCSRFNS